MKNITYISASAGSGKTYTLTKRLAMGTQHFKTISENPQDAQTILLCVYHALSAKGYDPITQIVGYLISGDPTYITSYQNARSLICRIDRDELLEELVQFYLSKNV